MPQLVEAPVRVPVPGGKQIDEYVGRASTGAVHVANDGGVLVAAGQAVLTRAGENWLKRPAELPARGLA